MKLEVFEHLLRINTAFDQVAQGLAALQKHRQFHPGELTTLLACVQRVSRCIEVLVGNQKLIRQKNNGVENRFLLVFCAVRLNIEAMGSVISGILAYIRALFLPRLRLALEAAALRQQLAVLKRKQPRPKLTRPDRLFWTVLRRLYSG